MILELVPSETWTDGGLELAAVEFERLVRVRGEEPARAGLTKMLREGTLAAWLADRRAKAAA